MQSAQIHELLKIVAIFVPNYKVNDVDKVKAWHRVLGNITFADAERYFYEHFQKSKFAPMPVEILERARAEFNPDAIVPIEPPDDMRGAQPHVK